MSLTRPTPPPVASLDTSSPVLATAPSSAAQVVRTGLRGRVKWFDDRRGYGFIAPERAREQIFVHQSAIVADGFRTLIQGQEVQYDLAQTERGVHALNVMVVPHQQPARGPATAARTNGQRTTGPRTNGPR